MAKRTVEESSLTAVADAIRERGGTSDQMVFPDGFVSAVEPLVHAEDYLASVQNKTIKEIVNGKMTGTILNDFQRDSLNLEKVDLPLITTLKSACFNGCKNLKSINFPSVTTIEAAAFGMCHRLRSVYFPSLTTITGWGAAFQVCITMKRAYFPKLTSIAGGNTFGACQELTYLILGADTVCTIPSTDTFNGTPIAGVTQHNAGVPGYIYVPAALVDSYKAATNWSPFADLLRSIEDYPEVLEGWE